MHWSILISTFQTLKPLTLEDDNQAGTENARNQLILSAGAQAAFRANIKKLAGNMSCNRPMSSAKVSRAHRYTHAV